MVSQSASFVRRRLNGVFPTRFFMELYSSDIVKEPLILGIESSCDETAAAVICGRRVLSDEIASSANIQSLYGGVVPEIASRAHTDAIEAVVERAVKNAGASYADLDGVAVTYGAGLLGALFLLAGRERGQQGELIPSGRRIVAYIRRADGKKNGLVSSIK